MAYTRNDSNSKLRQWPVSDLSLIELHHCLCWPSMMTQNLYESQQVKGQEVLHVLN